MFRLLKPTVGYPEVTFLWKLSLQGLTSAGNDINNYDFHCEKEGSKVSSLAKGNSQPNPSLPLISPVFMIKAVNMEEVTEDVFNTAISKHSGVHSILSFNPLQQLCFKNVDWQRGLFECLPTGCGKSLTYQAMYGEKLFKQPSSSVDRTGRGLSAHCCLHFRWTPV